MKNFVSTQPVTVEACQFDGSVESASEICQWAGFADDEAWVTYLTVRGEVIELEVSTLDGGAVAEPGDWVVKGTGGAFYRCKADVFEATYEAAPEQEGDMCEWCSGTGVIPYPAPPEGAAPEEGGG